MLSLFSQVLFYSFSDKFKVTKEVKSACQAIRTHFVYNSSEEVEAIDKKLKLLVDYFSPTDVYRVLLDVALADDKAQFDFIGSPAVQLQKLFDKKHHLHTAFWGQGYPRPSVELYSKEYLVFGNQNYDKYAVNEVLRVKGDNIYDMSTF